MSPLTLEGNTLGEKHKHFNKIVQNKINKEQINLTKINSDDTDIENLVKIDVASKARNVEYIIEVLKCNDMLYVSRAIKKSTWLITEQKYMHIINPEYLHEELFPYMLTKAINKFLLNIRLHLKDEMRIETFYTYLKDFENNDNANKWLLNCSIPFIEKIIQDQEHISSFLYIRLCKRSIKFLQYYNKVDEWYIINRVLFLLNSHTEEFLNILDVYLTERVILRLNEKYTEIIMKKFPNRILDNFEKYIDTVNFAVVAKYLKKEDIKNFLLKYIKMDPNSCGYFRDYRNLKHFVIKMTEEDRFEFVKKFYIDKNQTGLSSDSLELPTEIFSCNVNTYRWYEYAPFNIAFFEIKKLIRAERLPAERCAMLAVLIRCAKNHPPNINILLQHFYDKHRNEPFKFKIQFVNNVITQLPTHEFDSENWNILDKLFHTLEVYTESDIDVQSCVQAIVVYKVLHDEKIPDIVEKKLQFNTLKSIKNKLSEEQQTKVFTYLLNFMSTKIQHETITKESDLENVISLIHNILCLLKDWNKRIENYPFVRNKIQELLKINKENSWTINFSSLYNVDKSYRRHMFEESIMLCPGEQVLINALKHEPELLIRYSDVVDSLKTNDAVSMPRLLNKLRVYWSHSLAQDWINKNMNQMDLSDRQRPTIEGLFILLPQNHIIDIAKKYAPIESTIDWNELDEIKFGLQKYIAKFLHKARPLIDLDVVLLYAKGDYLQFTIPSLNALAHNMSKTQSRVYIDKLTHSPVSLQKYGLHLAFIKLKHDELKPMFSNIWKGTSNITIRTHIFTYTYNLLCRVKDTFNALELWNLLKEFIENLETVENKVIFASLGNPKKVHASVKGEFYMKSYLYLKSLPPAANAETYIDKLLKYAPNVIDILDEDFVADNLLSPIKEIISNRKQEFYDMMSSYVLFGKTEEEQCKRFRRVLVPALEHAFLAWSTVKDYEFLYKNNVDRLFQTLSWHLRKFLYFKNIVVPVQLFTEIKILIAAKLPTEENYVRYTTCTLASEYVKLVAEHKDMFHNVKIDNRKHHGNQLPRIAEDIWEALHIKISPLMGSIIVKLLKEDVKTYSSTIYVLFSAALEKFFDNLNFLSYSMTMDTLKYMIIDEDFIPSYLVVCNVLQTYGHDEEKKRLKEIREILAAHPSLEVQMHYRKALDMTP